MDTTCLDAGSDAKLVPDHAVDGQRKSSPPATKSSWNQAAHYYQMGAGLVQLPLRCNRDVVQPQTECGTLFQKLILKAKIKKSTLHLWSRRFCPWPNLVQNFELWRAADHHNIEFALYPRSCRLFVHFQVRIYFLAAATIEKIVWKHCNQFKSKIVVVGLRCWLCGSL